jgi:ribonuclease BN (tRNA processing enzyme)
MEPGKKASIGKVQIEAVPTRHTEPKCLGYVFTGSDGRVGYTADGEYYDGQEKHFRGCDYLLINCHRPKDFPLKEFMDSEGARKLVEKSRPGTAILTHFGRRIMKGVAEKEARWIQEKTGIRTIAARDGMIVDGENASVDAFSHGSAFNRKSGIGKFLGR